MENLWYNHLRKNYWNDHGQKQMPYIQRNKNKSLNSYQKEFNCLLAAYQQLRQEKENEKEFQNIQSNMIDNYLIKTPKTSDNNNQNNITILTIVNKSLYSVYKLKH